MLKSFYLKKKPEEEKGGLDSLKNKTKKRLPGTMGLSTHKSCRDIITGETLHQNLLKLIINLSVTGNINSMIS